MLSLPGMFISYFHLSMSGVSGRNGFKSIVSPTEGMLGNVCGRHRLAGGTCCETSSIIFFGSPGSGMCCQRSPADLCHLEHACLNPGAADFKSLARTVIPRAGLFKKGKHPFRAIRGPGCHPSLILDIVFFHKQGLAYMCSAHVTIPFMTLGG